MQKESTWYLHAPGYDCVHALTVEYESWAKNVKRSWSITSKEGKQQQTTECSMCGELDPDLKNLNIYQSKLCI